MKEENLTGDTINSLGEKLDKFSEGLSKEEQAVLLGLIGTAGAAFEQGHQEAGAKSRASGDSKVGIPANVELPPLSVALKDTFKGIEQLDPISPISDSVGVSVVCVSWSKDYDKTIPAEQLEELRIPGMRIR